MFPRIVLAQACGQDFRKGSQNDSTPRARRAGRARTPSAPRYVPVIAEPDQPRTPRAVAGRNKPENQERLFEQQRVGAAPPRKEGTRRSLGPTAERGRHCARPISLKGARL